jgi:IclR family transcriptional regulator, KDG regulon repressor
MEKTLAKGLIVLEALAQARGPCGVSDLAASLGISKSNTHRLLNTLVATGFASTVDGRYAASLKMWELGTKVIDGFDVRELARPAMTRLVRETAESVRLTVLDPKSLEVIYIDKIDSPQDVRTFTEIGGRAPAHCTSSGKVMLAYQDDAVVRRIARKLKAYTPSTIVDPVELMRHLKKVRASGYALNQREYSPQVAGVAAPIFNAEGRVVAALSIAAPADRLPAVRLKQVTARLCDAAASVSARIQPGSTSVVQLSARIAQLGGRKPRSSTNVAAVPKGRPKRRTSKE